MSPARIRPRVARLAAAALAAASLGVPGAAPAVEGFPGSTWGDFYWEIPSPGESDAVLEGWIRQGVAWKRWPAGKARLVLQTYATLRYKWDSLGQDWNNYLGPGLGVAVDLTAPRFPLVTAGVEYVHQWNTRSEVAAPYTAPFLDWFHWWDVAKGDWPGTTWGSLRWEIPGSGPDNLVLLGWARQGLVLHRWKAQALAYVLSPYVRVRYGLDTLGLDWNNFAGPGIGLALDVDGLRGFQPAAGIEYAWEKNLTSPGGVHRLDLVVRWYGWWDLKPR
jgi:hypothetical protein